MDALAQEPSRELPNLRDVRGLRYEPLEANEITVPRLSHADLLRIVESFNGYVRGARLLDRYKEPLLTRGNQGIAVFKKAAASVVLVVTGSLENDELVYEGLGTGVIVDPAGLVTDELVRD